jgi:hypothetical protein
MRWIRAAAVTLAVSAGAIGSADADNIVISYSPAGQTQANFAQLCAGTTVCDYGTENFSEWSGGNFSSSFTTGANSLAAGVSFGGQYAAIGGTTGSQWESVGQNQYGGSGAGNYPELFGPGAVGGPPGQTESGYQVTLSAAGLPTGAGINYFGVWISALDPFNDLLIYNTASQLIAQFNSPTLLAALGGCNNGSNSYCGNPTSAYAGDDNEELFAFVNVFDLTGTIGSVVFYDSGSTGFESDNDAVAYINPIHVYGASLDVPEPTSLVLLGSSLMGMGLIVALQRRHSRGNGESCIKLC